MFGQGIMPSTFFPIPLPIIPLPESSHHHSPDIGFFSLKGGLVFSWMLRKRLARRFQKMAKVIRQDTKKETHPITRKTAMLPNVAATRPRKTNHRRGSSPITGPKKGVIFKTTRLSMSRSFGGRRKTTGHHNQSISASQFIKSSVRLIAFGPRECGRRRPKSSLGRDYLFPPASHENLPPAGLLMHISGPVAVIDPECRGAWKSPPPNALYFPPDQ
jgi:hypothetical protein